jgi:DNA (cytosine-5)-methyltransferase 1
MRDAKRSSHMSKKGRPAEKAREGSTSPRNGDIRTLSLFTGAGGLDIGFHQAGFDVYACVEIDETFCRTLELNKERYFREHCKIICADIRDLQLDALPEGKCDFIIGGPPCQSFSAAGRRAGGVTGINDRRGSLFEHYCRLIEGLEPSGFLFENVRGILSSNKKHDWTLILASFSDLGYQISYRILDAADYGVPQHRERLILVGTKKGRNFLFPQPTHGADSISHEPAVSCGRAISDLQDQEESIHDYPGKYGDLLKRVPPGMNYHFFTRELGDPNPTFAWRSRFSDFLYKAQPDAPVRTIVSRLGAYSGPFHWTNRRFTVPEFKRLFTFPDDYELAGDTNIVLRQLGNSVPPLFAKCLAKAVRAQLFDGQEVDLIPADFRLSFDRRKKAKASRTRRVARGNRALGTVTPLTEFHDGEACSETISAASSALTYFCCYPNWKERQRHLRRSELAEGELFEISEDCHKGKCRITVSDIGCKGGRHEERRALLTYRLDFDHAIGDGLRSIDCHLISQNSEHVVALWDAIEDCLNRHTNFISLMDVFGHFTEPHPIFTLGLKIHSPKRDFLLRFIEYFRDFDNIAVDYPSSLMESLDGGDSFDFNNAVKRLRSLRFDVRVNETNPTIARGFFRCCYPFTLHVGKQISVSWVERREEKDFIVGANS